jgi:biopolymer transport protein ExbD
VRLSRPPVRRARVEIIPMIDTVFFLLVFFMMATLSMSVHRAMPVSLPQAATGGPATPQSVDITITREGAVLIDRVPIDPARIPDALRARAAAAPELAVVIHADDRVAHGRVVEVLDGARRAGLGRLAIAVRPTVASGAP